MTTAVVESSGYSSRLVSNLPLIFPTNQHGADDAGRRHRISSHLPRCGDMVAILISRPLAAAFVRPVDPALVPGYSDVVSKPMDLVRRPLSPS